MSECSRAFSISVAFVVLRPVISQVCLALKIRLSGRKYR